MTATTCKAPKASCGTASGWRAGGRCVRCRLAHNNDTSRRRGLTDVERYDFLAALHAGKSAEEAAEEVGVTLGALTQAARRDGELRAALDGMPAGVQAAARRAEFLAALVRCGGNQALAEAQAGLPPGTVFNWKHYDPEFEAVVAAILEWLGSAVARPRKPYVRLTQDAAERLRGMWAEGVSGDEIAAELRVNRVTVSRWRKQLGLPSRHRRAAMSARFRELWTSGAPYSEIRAELGISDPTISNWRKHLGLPGRAADDAQS